MGHYAQIHEQFILGQLLLDTLTKEQDRAIHVNSVIDEPSSHLGPPVCTNERFVVYGSPAGPASDRKAQNSCTWTLCSMEPRPVRGLCGCYECSAC